MISIHSEPDFTGHFDGIVFVSNKTVDGSELILHGPIDDPEISNRVQSIVEAYSLKRERICFDVQSYQRWGKYAGSFGYCKQEKTLNKTIKILIAFGIIALIQIAFLMIYKVLFEK